MKFIIVLLILVSCAKDGYKYKNVKFTVAKVLGCTNATADAWSGRREGRCKVIMTNGNPATIAAPTGVGDVVYIVKQVKKEENEK